jgi:predicted acetylornithine/succinylornithine family transaminase
VSVEDLQRLESEHLLRNYARAPVEFVRGEGAVLWDAEGEEYLDFLCGISVSSVGHCHPAVVAAIQEQAARLMHVSNLFYTEPPLRLAARLAESSLGGGVYFGNSGAEVVEAAIKLARKSGSAGSGPDARGIVSVHGAFHGRTYGALSATPQESKQAPFAPMVPGFEAIRPEIRDLDRIDGSVAAVIVEPVQGETGIHPLPERFLRALRERCDEYDTALIFDEIQCGLGRTGSLWAYEQVGVTPDLLLTAKALGGGMPIGALITSERFARVFEPGDHGSTFAGGPVVAAAGLAVLDIVEDPALLERVRDLGERLRDGLAQLPGVTAVRARGLMLAFDLEAGGAPDLVRRALLEQHLVVNATGPQTVRLLPPLIIDEAQADDALVRLRAVMES